MEEKQSHPIPQDVTGFQFKIIGDITVKQFVYLAAPSFFAWIFFQLPVPFLIKLPISLVLVGIGASLAFLPIAGRPMDVMIINFIKALFKSTLYIYQKKGMTGWAPTIKLTYHKPVAPPAPKEKAQKQQVAQMPVVPTPQPLLKTQATAVPTQSKLQPPSPRIISMQEQVSPVSQQPLGQIQTQQDKNKDLKRKLADLEKDLRATRKEKEALEKKQSQPLPAVQTFEEAAPAQQESPSLELEKQLQAVLTQKDQLTKQLIALQQKLEMQQKRFFTPTMAKEPVKTPTQHVRQIPKSLGKSVGLPIAPEAPNVITGIIKDPRGNPLPGILVEIKDNEGNPVRAFKTNGLGEFASATPLASGVYTITFEDPKGQNKFDGVEFAAKGEVVLPLEVISVDTREELRKTLFREN